MNLKRLLFALGGLLLLAPAYAQNQPRYPDEYPEPKLTHPAPEAPVALPAGTEVVIKLETALSTTTSKVGDSFSGRVTTDVMHEGRTVIPVGSSVKGKVVGVDEKRRYKGRPTLELRPEVVVLPNGERFQLSATVLDTSVDSNTKVDAEGKIMGPGINKRDKLEMAGGAAGGALIGGLTAKSAKGTLIGATIGGGVAAIYWLTKNKSAHLMPGTEIILELNRPMNLSVASD